MRGAVVVMLALCLPALAQDDKRVADLLTEANAEYEAGKEMWKTFVFSASEVTDDQIDGLLTHYDKAIDLCQKASEGGDVGEADTMVIRLARRTAQLRATLFAREQKVRAEEARRNKPPDETPPEVPPEEREPRAPEKEPAAPAPAPDAAARAPAMPEISETKAQRTRGIQSARDFLMNFYFANRKRDALVDRCGQCNGKGIVFLPFRDPKTQKTAKQECGGCGGTGYHLNQPVARKGFWLCWSPLHRADGQEKKQWACDLSDYVSDPRKIPEFLTSVRITELDYRGLWADVQWEEKGATAEGKRFSRKVQRKLIRAGRLWFFFDPERDKEFFSAQAEAD
jgi:hypothetical protein